MKKYDVVIVGAGPAGIAAAKVLKNNNLSFCIIDNKKFPRQKLCAGGLTPKAMQVLKELHLLAEKEILYHTNKVEIVAGNKSHHLDMTRTYFVDRTSFDFSLVQLLGQVDFFEEEQIVAIDNHRVKTNKQMMEYRYIIMADGVNGYSKRITHNQNIGFAVEQDVSVSGITNILVSYNAVHDGYGWFFPKGDYVTIGLGKFGTLKEKIDYKKSLVDFGKTKNIMIDPTKIKGYPIPNGKPIKKFVFDDCMIIVGDAAGLVDAITGEGIYYALQSGKLAAEAIAYKLSHTTIKLEKIYGKYIKKIKKSLKFKYFIARIFYSKAKYVLLKIAFSNKVLYKIAQKLIA